MRSTNSTRAILVAFFSGTALLFAALEVSFGQDPPPNGQQQNGPVQNGAVQNGAAQGAGAAQVQGPVQQPPQLQAPFTLTREEFDYLYTVLNAWEQRSAQIKTAKANFILWTDDPVFNKQKTQKGKVSYKAPDHGLYKVLGEDGDWVDHWVCDGKAVYDYDYNSKKVKQFTLPPELQGQNIAHGPLPFLFAAKKDDLVRRYWMRLVQPPADKTNDEIWIEAYPRTQNERANFLRATIILTKKEMLPYAIELYFENKGRSVHQFDWKINSGNPLQMFLPNEFAADVPRGWTKEVDAGMQDASGSGISSASNGGAIRQD